MVAPASKARSSIGTWKACRSSRLTSAQTMVLRSAQVKQLLRPEQVWVRLIVAIDSVSGKKTQLNAAVVLTAGNKPNGTRCVCHQRCRRSELATTDTELIAMAAAAIIGFRRPAAATGMATTL